MPTDLEIIKQLERELGFELEILESEINVTGYYTGVQLGNDKRVISLFVNNVQLSDFPNSIFDLKSLTFLDLWGNRLSELPREIAQLQNLTYLGLGGNQLSELPKEITQLTNLTTLDLGINGLSELPKEITQLQNLTYLGLGINGLSELPKEITQLQNLTSLNLSSNQISELPKEITQLQNLISLDLEGNPLTQPPPEIAAQGVEAVFEYLRQLPDDAEGMEHNEAKMILMGQGDVGKTCLANRLKYGEFITGQRTPGVNILEWDITAPTDEKEDVRLNVWDFGGQEIYHATHQFFLTKRSLYIVVWNARKSSLDYDNIHYWLNTVEAFGEDSPVILVMTKLNEWDDDLNMKDLKDRFPNIVGLYKVDSEDGKGIDELCKVIQEVSWKLPHMRTRWIDAWFNVRKRVEDDPRNFITLAEFQEMCDKEGLTEKQTGILDEYLHDLGLIIHFTERSLNLCNMVILKPNWATKAVYKVLDTQSVKDREGILELAELSDIWDETSYPSSVHGNLLELMNEFELAYQLPDKRYLVAELLPSTEPDFDWDGSDNLRFDYRYDFLPAGVMTRFIVRSHEDLDEKGNGLPFCWREGAVLKNGKARAFVKSKALDKLIEIRISGPQNTRREMLAIIRRQFDHINDRIKNVEIRKEIPCNCSEGCENTWEYDDLLRLESRGVDELVCIKSGEKISISRLLDGYERKETRQEKYYSDGRFNIEFKPHIEVTASGSSQSMPAPMPPPQPSQKPKKWHQRLWVRITAGVPVLITLTWTVIQIFDRFTNSGTPP